MSGNFKLSVFRYTENMAAPKYDSYEIPKEDGLTVLQGLFTILETHDDPPAFRRYQCNRGQCCSCLMTINGEVKRACTTPLSDETIVEPLHDYPIIRDLIVDFGKLEGNVVIRKGSIIQWPKKNWNIYRKHKNLIHFDADLCTECRLCQDACPINRYTDLSGKYGEKLALPILLSMQDGRLNTNNVCSHCSNAPCMYFCPAKVITRDDRSGAVMIEKEFCIGCGMCISACPNDAVFLDMQRGKAIKCELCGGIPQCVENCPTEALKYGSQD